MPIDISILPQDDADAAARAQRYAHDDPLSSVPRSLLSSAEIYDYVRLAGMIYPFSERALKSASYEAHIGGQCIWWDKDGQKQEQQIARGHRLVLQANSITFVQAEPIFRLPDYIAVRFNLRITHVHRGLLLGTGPLVDPGFEGKLLIPLHNLTSSAYYLNTNEALIWIEFTKTTHGVIPTEKVASPMRHFVSFPIDKKNLTPDQYLYKANSGRPIRSSIPEAITQGQKAATDAAASAKRAAGSAERLQLIFTSVSIGVLLAVVVAVTGLYFQVDSLIQSSITLSTSVNQTLAGVSADGKANADKLGAFQSQFGQFRQGLADVKTNADKFAASQGQIERLVQQLEQLSRDLEALKSQPQAPPGRAGRR